MTNSKPEIYIIALREAVQQRYGDTVATSRHFNLLSEAISETIGETLSVSTLKRMWGYVAGKGEPRIDSLDILARYAGAQSFEAIVASTKELAKEQSDFLSAETIQAKEMKEGDMIELSWMPDRTVMLRYEGGYHWSVEKNLNSKLPEGSRVIFSHVTAGYPLYADVMLPQACGTAPARPYIAGKQSGVAFKRVK